MLIKFKHPTGVSTIRISDTEYKQWSKVCKDEGDSLNETISWLWSQNPKRLEAHGNFTQWVRDHFLLRIAQGHWML